MSDTELEGDPTDWGFYYRLGSTSHIQILRLENRVRRLEEIAEHVVFKDTEYRTRGDDGRYMPNHFHHDLDQDDDPNTGA